MRLPGGAPGCGDLPRPASLLQNRQIRRTSSQFVHQPKIDNAMSSISNNRNQDRLRHLHGDGDRNYSAPGIGGAAGSDAQQTDAPSDDPISVALHMEALDQNVVESNHKVSSAIKFSYRRRMRFSANTPIHLSKSRNSETDLCPILKNRLIQNLPPSISHW